MVTEWTGRLDVRIKWLSVFVLVAAFTVLDARFAGAAAVVLGVFTLGLPPQARRRLLGRVAGASSIAVLLALARWWGGAGDWGTSEAAGLVLRVAVSVLAVGLVVETTPAGRLLPGLVSLGFPPFVVGTAELTLRYLGLVQSELERMRRARRARLERLRSVLTPAGLRHAGSLIGAFFLRCLDRGERVDLAWRARLNDLRFGGHGRRVQGRGVPGNASGDCRVVPSADAPASPSEALPAVRVSGVAYRYGDGTWGLRGVSLTVPVGSRTAILGPNGAGKSTLGLVLAGLVAPTEGRVALFGRELDGSAATWAPRLVGLVFQDPDDQVLAPSVGEDVRLGPLNLGLPPEEADRRARRALERVGLGWDALAGRPPQRLSLGQRKRVALAGVLAMDPPILFLDEPAANLDPAAAGALADLLLELSGDGKTLLLATHDVGMAAEWATQVFILGDGTVVAEGGPELLRDEGFLIRVGLGRRSGSRCL
ncbi:MAG: ATP-binding cassette domain-containing protein [Firmicutes bacterium]|nr:ATP-binding cassette domain-containing protein [Bacillota bacterium]